LVQGQCACQSHKQVVQADAQQLRAHHASQVQHTHTQVSLVPQVAGIGALPCKTLESCDTVGGVRPSVCAQSKITHRRRVHAGTHMPHGHPHPNGHPHVPNPRRACTHLNTHMRTHSHRQAHLHTHTHEHAYTCTHLLALKLVQVLRQDAQTLHWRIVAMEPEARVGGMVVLGVEVLQAHPRGSVCTQNMGTGHVHGT